MARVLYSWWVATISPRFIRVLATVQVQNEQGSRYNLYLGDKSQKEKLQKAHQRDADRDNQHNPDCYQFGRGKRELCLEFPQQHVDEENEK